MNGYHLDSFRNHKKISNNLHAHTNTEQFGNSGLRWDRQRFCKWMDVWMGESSHQYQEFQKISSKWMACDILPFHLPLHGIITSCLMVATDGAKAAVLRHTSYNPFELFVSTMGIYSSSSSSRSFTMEWRLCIYFSFCKELFDIQCKLHHSKWFLPFVLLTILLGWDIVKLQSNSLKIQAKEYVNKLKLQMEFRFEFIFDFAVANEIKQWMDLNLDWAKSIYNIQWPFRSNTKHLLVNLRFASKGWACVWFKRISHFPKNWM